MRSAFCALQMTPPSGVASKARCRTLGAFFYVTKNNMEDMTYRDLNKGELEVMHLLDDRPVAYKPALAKMFKSVKAGIMISQFLYWSRNRVTIERGGWFYKSEAEVYEETGLSAKEQRKAREILSEYYILDTKKMGMPARNWYRINYKKLIWVVGNFLPVPQLLTDQSSPKGSTGDDQKGAQVVPFREDIHITESTQESTAEGETSSPLLKIPGIIRGSEYRPDGISPRDVQAAKPRRERTPKQKAALPILLLMDYFRDEVKRLHNLSYLHREEDRNAKVRKQIDSAYSRFQEETRLFVDWWLNGGGAWCNYEPEACFTNRAFREYENKDVIAQQPTKAKGKEVRRI